MNSHENFERGEHLEGPSDRSFGVVFTVFFLLVGLAPLRHGLGVRWWSLIAGAAFLLVTLISPVTLRPLNKLWMQLSLVLSGVMTPVVMGILFYLVFAPLGLIGRLLGKDPLNLAFDPGARSYWKERQPPGPSPESMSNQF